jgi:hypothetical protein
MCGNRSDFKALEADCRLSGRVRRSDFCGRQFSVGGGHERDIGAYGPAAACLAKRSARAKAYLHPAQTTVTC